jgi:hypothetical protein
MSCTCSRFYLHTSLSIMILSRCRSALDAGLWGMPMCRIFLRLLGSSGEVMFERSACTHFELDISNLVPGNRRVWSLLIYRNHLWRFSNYGRSISMCFVVFKAQLQQLPNKSITPGVKFRTIPCIGDNVPNHYVPASTRSQCSPSSYAILFAGRDRKYAKLSM